MKLALCASSLAVRAAHRGLQGLALALVLSHGACSTSHGPSAGDTNTSWLKSCQDDADCTGQAQCLQELCTLPCSDAQPNACALMSVRASCEPEGATCDLRCVNSAECRELGAGYSCGVGRCRVPGSDLGGHSTPDVSNQALRLSKDSEPPSDWTLSNLDSAWLGDRWRVAFSSGRYGASSEDPGEHALSVVDVFPDAHLERQHVTGSNTEIHPFAQLAVGRDGRIAAAVMLGTTGIFGADGCVVRFHGPDAMLDVHALPVACKDWPRPVSLDAQGNWLIPMMHDDEASTELRLSRYHPERGWLDEPHALTLFPERYNWPIQVAMRGEQLWLYHSIPGVKSIAITLPLAQAFSMSVTEAAWTKFDETLLNQAYDAGATYYEDGFIGPYHYHAPSKWLELEPSSQRARITAYAADTSARLTPMTFELERSGLDPGSFAVLGRTVVTERGLIAFCYRDTALSAQGAVSGESLQVRVFDIRPFDTSGTPRSAPIELAVSDRGWNVGVQAA